MATVSRAAEQLKALWALPRDEPRPVVGWRDVALGAACLTAVIAEAVLSDALGCRAAAVVVGSILACLVPWRNRRPLITCAVAFSILALLEVVTLVVTGASTELNSAAFVLLFAYGLLRWGSGREAICGLQIMAAAWLVSLGTDDATIGDVVGSSAVLSLACVAGVAVRIGTVSRRRELDAVRMRERERLARELHDSVGHHVSAIAVQAQAGQAVAATAPAMVGPILAVIEEAASSALAEMRATVRGLRGDAEDRLATPPGIADVHRLVSANNGSVDIAVHVDDRLENLTAPVDLAVYRLAQEAVTNAVRHARGATAVQVDVEADGRWVRLTVTDDGEPARPASGLYTRGYGLEGMRERVAMLGGTISAGPRRERGWRVDVTLPRVPVAP